MGRRESVSLVELRLLDGPNLYFTRPAVKLVVALPGWLALSEQRARAIAAAAGGTGKLVPGAPATDERRRFVVRLASRVTRSLAGATRTNLAVRARVGPEPDQIVVAYPWRRRGAAEAFGREVVALIGSILTSRQPFAKLLDE